MSREPGVEYPNPPSQLLFITGCLFHSISRHWPANALYQKENEVSFTAVHDDHNAVGYLPQCKVLAEASLVLKHKLCMENSKLLFKLQALGLIFRLQAKWVPALLFLWRSPCSPNRLVYPSSFRVQSFHSND
jgi:hypothetical protein